MSKAPTKIDYEANARKWKEEEAFLKGRAKIARTEPMGQFEFVKTTGLENQTMIKLYDGYALLTKNVFLGNKPHELTVVMTNSNLGDIRRFAVGTQKEIKKKCKELNAKFNPVFKNSILGI